MAPSKTEILKNKRLAALKQLERLQEFALNQAADATLESLELRKASLEKLMQQFEGVQSKLEETYCDEETEQARTAFEIVYFEIHPLLSALIKTKINVAAPPVLVPVVNANVGRQGVRLPDLSVPKFTGDTTKWLQFIETFTSLVDRDATLSNTAKFQYLLLSVCQLPGRLPE